MNASASLEALARRRLLHPEEYYDRLAYEADPMGGYRLVRPQALPHVTINPDGFRGRAWTGREEVLLLGDSVTFGVGASGDEAVFTRFLERELGEPVADASVRAYRVFQHAMHLPEYLEKLPRLREAILWCGYADLLFWVVTGGMLEGAFQFQWKYPSGRRTLAGRLLGRIGWVARDSGAVPPCGRRGSLEELAQQVGVYARTIRDLCAGRGARLTVLLQPFVRERPGDPFLAAILDRVNQKADQKFQRTWYDLAQAFVRALKQQWARASLGARDCQELASEADFLDQVHLKEQSLARMARQLANGKEAGK